MPTDPLASKDAAAAAEVLAALMVKDQDETICRYPTCDERRRVRADHQPIVTIQTIPLCPITAHEPI